MKEAANSLLKVLEEPPEYAHIFLLAENLGDLLPTIRSRSTKIHVGPMAPAEIEKVVSERHAEWKPAERQLVARLSEGAPGRALGFRSAGICCQPRRCADLAALSNGTAEDHSAIFRLTETYRAGAEGQQKNAGFAARSLLVV